jgi:transposase
VYAKMELWTEIRRQVLTGQMSRREACRRHGLHWQTLKKILEYDEPPGYRRTKPPRQPKIGPFRPNIQAILDADRSAPKKQRHTARRIWQRLRAEHGFTGGYTIVKDAVRELTVGRREVFLPLSHPPGEAQVDFGFAEVVLGGAPTQVAVFVLTLPYSDAVYCQVFPRECTETFAEGHARAFAFFGGVPRRIAYDNTKTAVAKITGSRTRQVTREFQRLQSHFLFTPHFCLVRRANEKGAIGIERSAVNRGRSPRCWPTTERPSCRCRPGRSRPGGSHRPRPTRCHWSGSTPTPIRCRRRMPIAA